LSLGGPHPSLLFFSFQGNSFLAAPNSSPFTRSFLADSFNYGFPVGRAQLACLQSSFCPRASPGFLWAPTRWQGRLPRLPLPCLRLFFPTPSFFVLGFPDPCRIPPPHLFLEKIDLSFSPFCPIGLEGLWSLFRFLLCLVLPCDSQGVPGFSNDLIPRCTLVPLTAQKLGFVVERTPYCWIWSETLQISPFPPFCILGMSFFFSFRTLGFAESVAQTLPLTFFRPLTYSMLRLGFPHAWLCFLPALSPFFFFTEVFLTFFGFLVPVDAPSPFSLFHTLFLLRISYSSL